MAKMINVDELIEFCNTERSMLHAHNNSVACAALRRVVEFAKEYAVEAEPDSGWIRTATETTGNNVATMDYQTTGRFINYNYDNIEEMTEI